LTTSKEKSYTVAFRVDTEIQKEKLNEFFDSLSKARGEKKGATLAFLVEQYHKGFEDLKHEPSSIESILESVGCSFLKYEDREFKCFERFDAKRKPDNLGDETEKVFTRCESCKEGKAQKILEQYQNKMRGQNIRGLLSMIKTFETFASSGVPSTIYFCNRIKGRQVITGKKRMHCSKVNFELVPVDPACKNPKCRFFQEFTVKVDQEFPRETLKLIEGIAEDYKRIEDLTPKPKKEVEADQGGEQN
jgi:hypothetical protein